MTAPRQGKSSFDFRIWAIEKRPGRDRTTYRLRWFVAKRTHSRSFATFALADSQRSHLVSAARRGEAFDIVSGLPATETASQVQSATTWWEWSQQFVDLKWSQLAPTSRRSVASALTTLTLAIIPVAGPDRPEDRELRAALFRWAFNTTARKTAQRPEDFNAATRWLAGNSPALASLTDPVVLRAVLARMSLKQNGKPAAPNTTARNRNVLHSVFELAAEQGHFALNPLDTVKWRPPKPSEALDPRSVANPQQARALLGAVEQLDGGKRYRAFFGCIYYAALRPSEVAALRAEDLDIPAEGWGWLLTSASDAEISSSWSDHGQRRSRQLKHRRIGDVRPVPCPPQLTELLHQHVKQFPPGPSGRVFRGPYGGSIAAKTYGKYWAEARKAALPAVDQRSPLVRRPYDLRHSAVSTWLAAGVDSALVASWAGHSVAVLHRVYAHVLRGREDAARLKIEAILADESPTAADGGGARGQAAP